MDMNKEREAFETWLFTEFPNATEFPIVFYPDEGKYNHVPTQARWEAWQAAKASTVPQWISTSDRMPEEGEEVLVHNLGQVRQVTRDSAWAGGFKERNCYGWQAAYSQSHWMPKSIELPERYHFYYENDAKQKAMIEAAQDQS